MRFTLYGIPNCDTVKKAKTWLDKNGVSWDFHNYKTQGIDALKLKNWLQQVPLDKLLNKKSTTFRNLSELEKSRCANPSEAVALMIQNPSMIKRPVLVHKDQVLAVGFKPDVYAKEVIR